jgi:hypothetical protein
MAGFTSGLSTITRFENKRYYSTEIKQEVFGTYLNLVL